jgi:8-oxo-dGTP pyrophosphatase MutT (NUDIX family)
MELLFLRRPEASSFAAGAWVFPGGVVDSGDRTADLGGRFGPGVTREEPAALVAALREGFEETGILPADEPPPARELAGARERLLAGETDFGSVVRRLGVGFRGLEAAYFARWVTPPRLSRRYDARFFLVRHRGGEPRPVRDEHTAARWIAPAEAARRFEAGDLPMLYPTRKTVEALAGLGTLAEAFRVFRERTVEAMRPRLLVEGEEVRPVLPGDPEYGEAGRQLREDGSGPEEGPA